VSGALPAPKHGGDGGTAAGGAIRERSPGAPGGDRVSVAVARLMGRLADTPRDFLVEPERVSVAAVVSDVLVMAGGRGLDSVGAAPFRALRSERDRLRLVLVLCWLLADEELAAQGRAERIYTLMTSVPGRLAALVDPGRFVSDPDRREELVRVVLRALGMRPAGETPEWSEDRLSTVDSVRRHEVLVAAREADKRAQEAAARYSQV
jgi:hypothetical protein